MPKLSTILNVRGVFGARKKIYAIGAFFALASVTVAAVTYYGQHTGNFVISVTQEANDRGIQLSEEDTLDYGTPRLMTIGATGVRPVAQDMIYSENVRNQDGNYVSYNGQYYGYTFYLKNIGQEACNIDVSILLTGVRGYAVNATRLWFFNGDESQDLNGQIFKAPEEDGSIWDNPYDQPNIDFESVEVVYDTQLLGFEPTQTRKFTIIVWIEGRDPDCTDVGEKSILGSSVKFAMQFSIAEDEKEVTGA